MTQPVRHTTGNLLTAGTDALVNPVNTAGVMGAGLALAFRFAYPANYRAYRNACAAGTVQPGRMFVHHTGRPNPRFIINFPTKRSWRDRTRLDDIRTGLDDLVGVVADHNVTSIAIPALGCGLGGQPWELVRKLIEEACTRIPHVPVVIYGPLTQRH